MDDFIEEYTEPEEPEELDEEVANTVLEWKKEYEDIYLISVKDENFVYRLITSKEFKEIQENYDEYSLADKICELCILDPILDNWESDMYAGYADTIAQDILENSGVLWDKERITKELDSLEEELSDLSTIMTLTIKKSFPEYTLDTIESWNIPKKMKMFSYAKWMIQAGGVDFELESVE